MCCKQQHLNYIPQRMLAVSIIVLSASCGHYALLSDCPIPSLLLLLLLLQLRYRKCT